MKFFRLGLFVLFGCDLFATGALAQVNGEAGGAPDTTAGGVSSFGVPSAGSATSPFGSSSWPSTPNLADPSLHTTDTGATPAASSSLTGGSPGAASAFGAEQSGGGNRTLPTAFTVPGQYGRASQQYVAGEGRLARPKFRYHGSLSTGYDDNVFQAPTRGASSPEQRVAVLIKPAVPTYTDYVTAVSGDPLVPDSEVLTEIPGSKAQYRYEKTAAVQAAQRIGSWVTRASAGFDVQMANRRNLFTFDLDAGDNYYWNRPGKKSDYNGTMSFVYLRKLTGRAQFAMTLNASYQNEPNFSLPNQPTSNSGGSHLSANGKADLTYRLTPRFSTVMSISYNSVYTPQQAERSGDYGETILGTEIRYLFSPRLTLLGELRYSSSIHSADAAQDTNGYFLLAGGEITLTRRFSASLRVGTSLQTYTQSGASAASPYLEATADYHLGPRTTVQWNGRYGFENSGSANTRSTVARSGLALTHIFSPRLQASVAVNLVHNQMSTTSDVTTRSAASDVTTADQTAPTAQSKTKTATTETIQDVIDTTVGFHYTLDPRWKFNLSFTHTMAIGPQDTASYYRQQIFLGTEYAF